MATYRDFYTEWQSDPEAFWAQAGQAVDWTKVPVRVLDDTAAPFYRWFADAEANTCYNAVDRHVQAGRGDQPAIIHDSPVTGSKSTITYAELLEKVSRLAGVLTARGVEKGDRVVIDMPMVPEALVAMLACARIGSIHSVVFGGCAAHVTCSPDQRRGSQGGSLRILRNRGITGHRVQASSGRGDCPGRQ